MCVCACVCVCHLPMPPNELNATESNCFMWSIPGLNSDILFSMTGCHTKVKEHNLPFYFAHILREKSWMHIFCNGIITM